VLNKTDKDVYVKVGIEGGIKDQIMVDADQKQLTLHGKSSAFTVFVKASEANILQEVTPIEFRVFNVDEPTMQAEYTTMFNGPKH
jgi:hypothetical protein